MVMEDGETELVWSHKSSEVSDYGPVPGFVRRRVIAYLWDDRPLPTLLETLALYVRRKMFCYLPEPVLTLILLWLLVISILQFLSVCKTCHCLITSPYFISSYTTRQSLKSHRKDGGNPRTLVMEEFSPFVSLWQEDEEFQRRSYEMCPAVSTGYRFLIIGCFHCLICGINQSGKVFI